MEILNKKARFDYFIEEAFECGIVLTGTEVKSIRAGNANLKDTYGMVRNNELYLINMYIGPYKEGNIYNHDERGSRKLLMHKKQIQMVKAKSEKEGYTLVPLKLYFKNNKVKILLGLGKGKKDYDKRETIKQRDIERELRRES